MLAPWARFLDLDGALLLQADRSPSMDLHNDTLDPPSKELWG
jgi:hypothetical protein